MRATDALPDICEAICGQISAVSETLKRLKALVFELQDPDAMLECQGGAASESEDPQATVAESGHSGTEILATSAFGVNDIAVAVPEPATYYSVTSRDNRTGVSTVSLPLTQAAAECMMKLYEQRFPECSHSMDVVRGDE